MMNQHEEHTPMMYDEFAQCNSVYIISDKDSDSAISSDGEFNDAQKLTVFNEDDSRINQIESMRDRTIRDSIYKGFYQFSKHQNTNGGIFN